MTSHQKVVLTVRFLQPYAHGRGEGGHPEWPPSPLRLFQALVSSGIGRVVDAARRERHEATLRWLERLAPPHVVASEPLKHRDGTPRVAGHRGYVPDNVGDKAAAAWARGRDGDLASFRTEKDVRSLMLPDEACVAYEYTADTTEANAHLSTLTDMMRSVTHLGWGIDQVAGDAQIDGTPPPGERWEPRRMGEVDLRAPRTGTLDALEARHKAFLGRLPGDDMLIPVPPLSTFERVRYGRASEVERRPFIAFRIVEPSTGDRLAIDPARHARDVAAWLRNRVGQLTQGWEFGDERVLVHGHTDVDKHGGSPDTRFAYLPLPTIAPWGKDKPLRSTDIARVMLVGPASKEVELLWLEQQLLGECLSWQGRDKAMLEFLPAQDNVLRNYTGGDRGSTTWTTVTPVVLPGLDGRSEAKTEKLLRKAFLHAGYPPEVVERLDLTWSKPGFFPGVAHADRHLAPDKVTGPQYHVRATFPEPVLGPIAIGSGRYRGLGTFVALGRR